MKFVENTAENTYGDTKTENVKSKKEKENKEEKKNQNDSNRDKNDRGKMVIRSNISTENHKNVQKASQDIRKTIKRNEIDLRTVPEDSVSETTENNRKTQMYGNERRCPNETNHFKKQRYVLGNEDSDLKKNLRVDLNGQKNHVANNTEGKDTKNKNPSESSYNDDRNKRVTREDNSGYSTAKDVRRRVTWADIVRTKIE